MDCFVDTSKQFIQEIRSGLPSDVITISDKNLVASWARAAEYFNICYDIDTSDLPFVFEACLVDVDTRVVEPYSVYVACMACFYHTSPDARGVRFGAISAIGRTDKFTPEQIINIALEGRRHAQKTLAEVRKIW